MSWHFLERWIEKANHHSTLVGKFWITFLIVCRMVIVASVGDRVYSDEQSEFKCNTLQPGCTNVCFNKFSPISHLRFWSFQILLVATPSVMFIIYSGHDPKGPKNSKKKSKKKSKQSVRKQNPQAVHSGGDGGTGQPGRNNNANNNNSNNNNSNSCDERNKKSATKTSPARDLGRSGVRDEKESNGRYGRAKSPRGSPTPTHTPQVIATLINYKNGEVGSPVEASIVDEKKAKKESNLPWLEMRWNSLIRVTESGTKNNKNDAISRNMWKVPKDSRTRSKDPANDSERNDKKKSVNGDIVMWRPPSSDEDNRNGKIRRVNPSPPAEADVYQNAITDAAPDEYEKQHELAIMGAHPPPDYPGNEWGHAETDRILRKGKRHGHGRSFGLPELEFVKTRTKKPRFTRHFNLYFVSVFVRLALELAFLLMQIYLYGFTVPPLYKCEQWPCPNMVDCFISRPMEKTIFLYFMLVYTCICVLLNACELKYLTWVYLFGRPKLRAKKYDEEIGEGNIVYDANGEAKYSTRFLDQDSDFDERDLAEIEDDEEYDAMMRNGYGFVNQFQRGQYDDIRGRGKRNMYARDRGRYRDRQMQEKMADMRRHELDLILNAEEIQDDFDMDLAQNDPVADMMQMDIQSHGSGGNMDNFR